MRVLVASPGEWDPWIPAVSAAGPLAGPVLRIARASRYDHAFILASPDAEARANDLAVILGREGVDTKAMPADADVTAITAALLRIDTPTAMQVDLAVDDPDDRAAALAAGGFAVTRLTLRAAGPLEEDLIERHPLPTGAAGMGREPRPGSWGAVSLGPRNDSGEAAQPDPEAVAQELGLIGTHPAFLAQCAKATAIAPHGVPILIQGETGTGKGLMARYLHALSPRAGKPFIAVNCSALPEQLAESLLFGHIKGAFTGAATDQPGKFLQADGGTLFLDEIGELPLTLQPKLLRALEEGWIEPLGAAKARRVDVRVIAATHKNLPRAVMDRTFREDLYFRLSFATIEMPALRERRSDIQALALHALQRTNRRLRTPRQLSTAALRTLEAQPWRGNIRDLENVIGRSALMSRSETLGPDDLLLEPILNRDEPSLPEPHEGFSLESYLSEARRRLIDRALSISHGKQAGAARLLGISPQAVHKFLQQQDPNRG